MNLLTIKGLSKEYTDRKLFDGIDFSLETNEKVGIIGINGTGKSTLLKIIAGIECADDGEYIKGNNVVINYLPQTPIFAPEVTIYDYVVKTNAKYQDTINLEGEAKIMLNKLGFDDISAKVDTLSGGQKKRVALAGALLSKSDILILDEPTNHLDNEMSEWLEEWLQSYSGALIMVTHDRYFLDLVCNRIVELDKGKLYSYKTNYEGFLQLKSQREEMALSTQAKHANILRKEIAWIQRGARARSTKQKAHIKRYEDLLNEEKVEIDGNVAISAVSTRLGNKTIEINGISKVYGSKKLISDFTFNFLRDDRIGILGKNGCGKTTLLRLIMGLIPADSGNIEIGSTVNIGYYAQEAIGMNPEEKVIDYIKDTAEYIKTPDGGYISASQMLENFLFFGALQYQKIEKLSGGEKRRLYLAKILMGAPNVLILDEPTNDLDISTLCVLEDYLDSFQGILIAVSHDRYFLDRVARRMLTFEGNGKVTLYNGSYTDYFNSIRDDSTILNNKKSLDGAQNYKQQKLQNKKLKFTYQEQREYQTIENDILSIEEEISKLDAQINAPNASSDFVLLAELSEKKENLENELETKLERFVYLSELEEKIQKGETL